MEHSEGADFAPALTRISKPRSPRAQNSPLDGQKRAHRGSAETNEVFRIREVDLSLNKRQTYLRLLGCRRSVTRRPPRNDISDIDCLSIQSDRAEHSIQQLACSSDEWAPDSIFFSSRGLPDEHDPRARDAVGEYKLRGGPAQRTAVEIRHCDPQRLQIPRRPRERPSRGFESVG